MTYSIAAEGLVKRFGETTALAGVDLTVADRHACSACSARTGRARPPRSASSPRCCGPTTGRRRYRGYDVADADAHQVRQLIGLTGQYASVDDDLTGTENLIMIGRLLGLSRPSARAARGRAAR